MIVLQSLAMFQEQFVLEIEKETVVLTLLLCMLIPFFMKQRVQHGLICFNDNLGNQKGIGSERKL